jgi:UDP-N-acetylglucosamine 2-epimerase
MRSSTVFGTHPETIKLALVIRELRRHPDRVVCKVCVTAQQRSREQGSGGAQERGRAENPGSDAHGAMIE